jgi:hypothetical protein
MALALSIGRITTVEGESSTQRGHEGEQPPKSNLLVGVQGSATQLHHVLSDPLLHPFAHPSVAAPGTFELSQQLAKLFVAQHGRFHVSK